MQHSLDYLQINECVLSVQVYDATVILRLTMPNNPIILMVVEDTTDHTVFIKRPIFNEKF